MKTILVTGGCGYKGSVLVPKLLAKGYKVEVIDTQWFGNFLVPHKNLKIIKEDVRNIDDLDLTKFEIIIHLSSVANDPCGDLNPKLTWEISALATMKLADKAVRSGVKQFIYASSGSVYGIKDEDQVTEDLELKPISEYNKTKMVSERVLMSYSDKIIVQIIRPATVCGFSPRMRFDISVNALSINALENQLIKVHGGSQLRPNIHIEDITNLYLYFIEREDKIQGIFNAGFENLSILEVAEMVSEITPAKIEIEDSLDPRSYRINSDKLLATGFSPEYTVKNAIEDLCHMYTSGKLKNESKFNNLDWMLKHNYE